ncbi:hypothetical protein BDZ45DRAFT_700740 [Acephala macrosclerotiorum]|nr:hypothetical protein BDZ45DRAFT_700740 [Acephala macrosclerotiorum]
MYSLPVRRLKDILSHVLPDVTLNSAEELKSTQLAKLYTLKMSDEKILVLSFAPSLAVRLLRQEATILSSEAILINFIAESNLRWDKKKEVASSPKSKAKAEDEEEDDEEDERERSAGLLGLVPKLLKHSSNNREMAYPYTILEPTPGEPLSNLSPQPSASDRRNIDEQVGSMARALADLISPADTFGMVNKVLTDPYRPVSPTAPPIVGSKTWSEGFNTVLEGILRDGEDMSVLLPYEVIRSHFQRLSYRLDAVTLPRLVVLDIHDPKNVMVERDPDDEETMLPSENIRLTGLRSWSQGVFGDPLIANCFEDPTEGFQEGWHTAGEDIIEDEENLETRLLLYRCYRAVVEIVTEYYRPKPDSSRRELAGRRKLTQVLAELEKVDIVNDDAIKRVRSSSTDDESSKRIKIEAKDE